MTWPNRISFPYALAGLAVVLVFGMVVTLLVTQVLAPILVTPPKPHPTPPSGHAVSYPPFGLMPKMASADVGWAQGGLRTTDGGLHWRNVTPAAEPDMLGPGPEFYLDADHAWFGEFFIDHVIMFRTVDGGKSWMQGASVMVDGKYPNISGSVTFLDSMRGWLFVFSWPADSWPNPVSSSLYKTADGGLHWVPLQPAAGCLFSSGPVFATPDTGWADAQCHPEPAGGRVLLATHDGGLTWRQEAGPCPPCGATVIPDFIDKKRWMFVDGLTLYTTADSGATWQVRQIPGSDLVPPPGQLGGPRASVSFPDPNHGWALVWLDTKAAPVRSSRLYRTSDGGRTWSLIKGNLPDNAPDGAEITFVDLKNGFAIHRLSTTEVQLLRTRDGGQTWNLVDYRVQES